MHGRIITAAIFTEESLFQWICYDLWYDPIPIVTSVGGPEIPSSYLVSGAGIA